MDVPTLQVLDDGDRWISLRDVQDIVVKPYAQYQAELNAIHGSKLVVPSTNPSMMALVVRTPNGFVKENFFLFTDTDLAGRVAKALTHAVELCGGGNKEPF